MPLTFAHPVAVLPLKRSGLPLSALIVGSIAPDLEYLLHLAPRSDLSHTMIGLVVFCVPAGLITLGIFHGVWKQPLRALFIKSSHIHQDSRHPPFPFWPLSRLATLSAALLAGALTHLVWDSFTHQYGWMVQQVSALNYPIIETQRGIVPLFKILQHGSTLLGLVVLALMAIRHPTWINHFARRGWLLLVLVLFSSAVVGVCVARLQLGHIVDVRSLQKLVGISIVVFFATFLTEVTFLSLFRQVKNEDPNQH